MPDWAKSLLKNQDESKVQIEFLMAQLLELKAEAVANSTTRATSLPIDSSSTRAIEVHDVDSHWDAAKRGAKPEVTIFDGSLDPKKYMDWEVGLEEYFDWYQLPQRTPPSIRTNKAIQASPNLLEESVGHGRTSARGNDHHVGGNEGETTRKIRAGMLSAYDN